MGVGVCSRMAKLQNISSTTAVTTFQLVPTAMPKPGKIWKNDALNA
jgi:hypothetical protein